MSAQAVALETFYCGIVYNAESRKFVRRVVVTAGNLGDAEELLKKEPLARDEYFRAPLARGPLFTRTQAEKYVVNEPFPGGED